MGIIKIDFYSMLAKIHKVSKAGIKRQARKQRLTQCVAFYFDHKARQGCKK